MGVVGSISIKDNVTAVLRGIRAEQSSFKQSVADTKKELKSTWEKQYKARLDAAPATKKITELRGKLAPLSKKLAIAIAVKDLAMEGIKRIGSKVKEVGKMVAKPVVNVAVKGAKALAAVGKGVAEAAKVAAIGIGAIGAAGAAALKGIYNGSADAARAQIEAETKLEAVLGNVPDIAARGAGAARQAKDELMGVASGLQQVGVIGDEVTLAGMQQLATFQLSEKEIGTLAEGMTDLLAQQKGLNASQEDAVSIGNLIGKAMSGQTGALSRVGIIFDETQEKALKTGDAEQRAAVMAEILKQNVGGVNQAMAQTDQGRIQQMANAYGDMKEEVGKVVLSIQGKFAAVIMKNIPTIQKLGTTMMDTISKVADQVMPVLDGVISGATPVIESALEKMGGLASVLIPVLSDVFSGLKQGAGTVRPLLEQLVTGFAPMIPQIVSFGTAMAPVIQGIADAWLPALSTIISTVQEVMPVVLPVIQTVVTEVGSIFAQAAPVISGLVSTIGTVVMALAPVFQTVFSDISSKVGRVISFVSERMGFIQEVIGTVAPVLGDAISGAWSVISPILDLAVSAFELVFSVVERVFPGIQSILEKVWKVVGPIVEGIGSAVGEVAGKVSGWIDGAAAAISGRGGKKAGSVGANAKGDNNWKGGVTWVGEEGPELVDLPKGSRILPHKESISLAGQGAGTVVQNSTSSFIQNSTSNMIQNVMGSAGQEAAAVLPLLGSMDGSLKSIVQRMASWLERRSDRTVSDAGSGIRQETGQRLPVPPYPGRDAGTGDSGRSGAEGKSAKAAETGRSLAEKISIRIAKLADQIVVRDEADIDEIADRVAKKITDVVINMG